LHGLVKYTMRRLVFWMRSEPDRILG
jgi:hypothetical protein